jgi:hypothetical protein
MSANLSRDAGWLSARRQGCGEDGFSPLLSRTNGLLDFAGSGVVHMVGGGAGAGEHLTAPRSGPALTSLPFLHHASILLLSECPWGTWWPLFALPAALQKAAKRLAGGRAAGRQMDACQGVCEELQGRALSFSRERTVLQPQGTCVGPGHKGGAGLSASLSPFLKTRPNMPTHPLPGAPSASPALSHSLPRMPLLQP